MFDSRCFLAAAEAFLEEAFFFEGFFDFSPDSVLSDDFFLDLDLLFLDLLSDAFGSRSNPVMLSIVLKQVLRIPDTIGALSSLIRKRFRITFRSLATTRPLSSSSSSSGMEISPPRKRKSSCSDNGALVSTSATLCDLTNVGCR